MPQEDARSRSSEAGNRTPAPGTAEPGRVPGAGDPGPMADQDPWRGDPRLVDLFGQAWPAIAGYHRMLATDGVVRGLVGPREVARLWERHLLNCAAVVPLLPEAGRVVDVGSGAGLPGVVVAAMRPDLEVVLLEPMKRRTDWLLDVIGALGLTNVVVLRDRADQQHGRLHAGTVTARAVAPLGTLYRWTLPLVEPGGVLLAVKGSRAQAEVDAAAPLGRRLGGTPAQIVHVRAMAGAEETTVVRVWKRRAERR